MRESSKNSLARHCILPCPPSLAREGGLWSACYDAVVYLPQTTTAHAREAFESDLPDRPRRLHHEPTP